MLILVTVVLFRIWFLHIEGELWRTGSLCRFEVELEVDYIIADPFIELLNGLIGHEVIVDVCRGPGWSRLIELKKVFSSRSTCGWFPVAILQWQHVCLVVDHDSKELQDGSSNQERCVSIHNESLNPAVLAIDRHWKVDWPGCQRCGITTKMKDLVGRSKLQVLDWDSALKKLSKDFHQRCVANDHTAGSGVNGCKDEVVVLVVVDVASCHHGLSIGLGLFAGWHGGRPRWWSTAHRTLSSPMAWLATFQTGQVVTCRLGSGTKFSSSRW